MAASPVYYSEYFRIGDKYQRLLDHLPWWMFALSGIIAIVIALITVSYQAIKAAIANPVESLRTE
jgi:putative ABC transport system permease protein